MFPSRIQGSRKWQRYLLVTQMVLSMLLIALGVYTVHKSLGATPAVVSVVSVNLIVVSCVALIFAIIFIRLIQGRVFDPLTAVLANIYCLVHLLAVIIYGATYLHKLSLTEPWHAHDDICYHFNQNSGTPCTVDKTYIAAFALACLNFLVSAAIIITSLFAPGSSNGEPSSTDPDAKFVSGNEDHQLAEFSYVDSKARLQGSSLAFGRVSSSEKKETITPNQGSGFPTQERPATNDTMSPVSAGTSQQDGVQYPVTQVAAPPPLHH